MPGTPNSIDDLVADPNNPREIDAKAAAGLSVSLEEFGDLSGITFNTRTGQLVCGHQRVQQLKAKGATLDVEHGCVVLPATGESFPVRLVDWPLKKQRAANVAANSAAISGKFTPEVDLFLDHVQADTPELYDSLLLDEIRQAEPAAANAVSTGSKSAPKCPHCGGEL